MYENNGTMIPVGALVGAAVAGVRMGTRADMRITETTSEEKMARKVLEYPSPAGFLPIPRLRKNHKAVLFSDYCSP